MCTHICMHSRLYAFTFICTHVCMHSSICIPSHRAISEEVLEWLEDAGEGDEGAYPSHPSQPNTAIQQDKRDTDAFLLALVQHVCGWLWK